MGVKISAITLKSTPDGTEEVEVNDNGVTKKVTTAAIAALSNIDILTVSTDGGTITLNFATGEQIIFVGSSSFAGPKDIALSNATNAKSLQFLFQITNVAAVLTFPAAFVGDTSDPRWDATANTWTSDFAIGVFRATAIFSGTNWILDISKAPYA